MAKSAQTPVEYSLAEASSHLAEVAEEALQHPVRIVRPGRPPLLLIAEDEFRRAPQQQSFFDALMDFRRTHDLATLDLAGALADVRDRTAETLPERNIFDE